MRTGVQRSLSGVGPEYHVFQAETLSLVRRVSSGTGVIIGELPEDDAVRAQAWHEVEEALRMPTEFAEVGRNRLRARLSQCDRVLQAAAPGTKFPPFERRPTAAGRFTQAPSGSYAATLELTFRPFVAFTLKTERNPVCTIRVTADADRSIRSVALLVPSDVPEWDEAVLRAVKHVGVLPRDASGSAPGEVEITFRLR